MVSGGVLPLAAMEKLMKKNGAARVSADAKEALRDALEDKARLIAEKANLIAKHSGRSTVKAEDVKLSIRSQH